MVVGEPRVLHLLAIEILVHMDLLRWERDLGGEATAEVRDTVNSVEMGRVIRWEVPFGPVSLP